MTSRFFVPPQHITHQRFVIRGSEARHAAVVLRKKVGDEIDLFDGKDLSFQGRIEVISPDRVEGAILAEGKTTNVLPVELILCQALIKGPKWDWLVEKACEVGVAKLIPLITARTVVKPSKAEASSRWQRIALAASKQCGRSRVMEVGNVTRLDGAFREVSAGSLSLIPWEKESAKTIRQACAGFGGRQVRLFIGPEGGWEAGEIDRAGQHGVIPVRLGPTLLRSETAGIVASTLVLSELGVYS